MLNVLSTTTKSRKPRAAICSTQVRIVSGERLRMDLPSINLVVQKLQPIGQPRFPCTGIQNSRRPEIVGIQSSGSGSGRSSSAGCEKSAGGWPSWKVEARQSVNVAATRQAIQQRRENGLSFAPNSHVGPEISQRALGKYAVTGPAKDHRSVADAPASRYHIPHRRQQEPRAGHVLVINVAYGDPNHARGNPATHSRMSVSVSPSNIKFSKTTSWPAFRHAAATQARPSGSGRMPLRSVFAETRRTLTCQTISANTYVLPGCTAHLLNHCWLSTWLFRTMQTRMEYTPDKGPELALPSILSHLQALGSRLSAIPSCRKNP